MRSVLTVLSMLAALPSLAGAAQIVAFQDGITTTDAPAAPAAVISQFVLPQLLGASWTPNTAPGGAHISNSYVQFDLTAFAGQTITDATLTLAAAASPNPSTYGPSPTATTPVTVDLYAVNGSWDPSTLTYGTAPSNSNSLLASAVVNSSSGSVSFSGAGLNALVQSWLSGSTANDGLVLMAAQTAVQDVNENYVAAWFSDFTAAGPPTLSFAVSAPEPSSLVLGLAGVIGLLGFGWRRRRAGASP